MKKTNKLLALVLSLAMTLSLVMPMSVSAAADDYGTTYIWRDYTSTDDITASLGLSSTATVAQANGFAGKAASDKVLKITSGHTGWLGGTWSDTVLTAEAQVYVPSGKLELYVGGQVSGGVDDDRPGVYIQDGKYGYVNAKDWARTEICSVDTTIWHKVALEMNRTDKTAKIYLDGVLMHTEENVTYDVGFNQDMRFQNDGYVDNYRIYAAPYVADETIATPSAVNAGGKFAIAEGATLADAKATVTDGTAKFYTDNTYATEATKVEDAKYVLITKGELYKAYPTNVAGKYDDAILSTNFNGGSIDYVGDFAGNGTGSWYNVNTGMTASTSFTAGVGGKNASDYGWTVTVPADNNEDATVNARIQTGWGNASSKYSSGTYTVEAQVYNQEGAYRASIGIKMRSEAGANKIFQLYSPDVADRWYKLALTVDTEAKTVTGYVNGVVTGVWVGGTETTSLTIEGVDYTIVSDQANLSAGELDDKTVVTVFDNFRVYPGTYKGDTMPAFEADTFNFEEGTTVAAALEETGADFIVDEDGTVVTTGNIGQNYQAVKMSGECYGYAVLTVGEQATQEPTQEPTQAPTQEPTQAPTQEPTQAPTLPPVNIDSNRIIKAYNFDEDTNTPWTGGTIEAGTDTGKADGDKIWEAASGTGFAGYSNGDTTGKTKTTLQFDAYFKVGTAQLKIWGASSQNKNRPAIGVKATDGVLKTGLMDGWDWDNNGAVLDTTVPQNQWVRFAIEYDVDNSTATLYMNGEEIDTIAMTGHTETPCDFSISCNDVYLDNVVLYDSGETTEAPTTAPTEAPTTAPTDAPTDAPTFTPMPTDTPIDETKTSFWFKFDTAAEANSLVLDSTTYPSSIVTEIAGRTSNIAYMNQGNANYTVGPWGEVWGADVFTVEIMAYNPDGRRIRVLPSDGGSAVTANRVGVEFSEDGTIGYAYEAVSNDGHQLVTSTGVEYNKDQWNKLAYTVDTVNDKMYIYLNDTCIYTVSDRDFTKGAYGKDLRLTFGGYAYVDNFMGYAGEYGAANVSTPVEPPIPTEFALTIASSEVEGTDLKVTLNVTNIANGEPFTAYLVEKDADGRLISITTLPISTDGSHTLTLANYNAESNYVLYAWTDLMKPVVAKQSAN